MIQRKEIGHKRHVADLRKIYKLIILQRSNHLDETVHRIEQKTKGLKSYYFLKVTIIKKEEKYFNVSLSNQPESHSIKTRMYNRGRTMINSCRNK